MNCVDCHQDAYPAKDAGVAHPESKAPGTVPVFAESADFGELSRTEQNRGLSPSPTPANPEPKESPLMIANRDKCLECHSPRQENLATPLGGARFDCAECHRYHSRDTATFEMPNSKPR